MSKTEIGTWSDGDLATVLLGPNRFAICVRGRTVGEITVYPSFPGAWQQIHGYPNDDQLWSFDIDISDEADRGMGYGSRTVRLTAAELLRSGAATRVVVDVHADNPRAVAAYERAGFSGVRFLADHDDGDGDIADAWLMEFEPSP